MSSQQTKESDDYVLDWTEVDSSNVHRVAYVERLKTLVVQFNNGGLYTYLGPDHEIYVDLVHAPSVGQYLHQVVKATYPYTRWNNEAELVKSLNIHKA